MAGTLVGGLRARMIEDSTFTVIHDGLTALGWFDGGRQHLPVTFIASAPDPTGAPIPFNTLALSSENVSSADVELGSNMAEMTRAFYVDFFAESDALGIHLIGDVRDILEGRLPSIGRHAPSIPVYDYTQATPPHVFSVDVESARIDRAHGFTHPWNKHWFSIQFNLSDTYGDEND